MKKYYKKNFWKNKQQHKKFLRKKNFLKILLVILIILPINELENLEQLLDLA